MFKAGETWRHISCTEIDLFFVSIQYVGPAYIKAKVLYFNRQATEEKNQLISITSQSVKIKKSDLSKWVRVE